MSRRIAEIRLHPISVPLERAFWMSLEPYRVAAEIVVEVETDDGLVGVGQIHGRPQPEIVRILEAFSPSLVGEDPADHERIWDTLFRSTFSRGIARFEAADGQPHFGAGSKPQLMAAIAGIDIALWDVKARAAGLPLYKLLGACRSTVACYASGGYYGADGEADLEGLVAEMAGYAALGFAAVKMKVGGLSLAEDVARVRAVREALPEVRIMLDANSAYDVPSAIEAAQAFEPLGIHWFEEPVAWFDPVVGLGRVAAHTSVSLASGERELHRFGCRDLVDHSGIRYLQFDATRAGGITEWLRCAAYAGAHGVLMAPHHDPQIHGHLVAAVPNGYVLEVFPNPVRDPLWSELFVEQPPVVGGELVLGEAPGLGVTLNRDTLARYAAGATR
ncbi:MAG: mandelate racemase/muconate lactonizing enzyme family protein [Actinobacteria bacterium]|nr:mandelate racemase/muconate lactonizing enzyme family protein [Actinomycetota bacterium]